MNTITHNIVKSTSSKFTHTKPISYKKPELKRKNISGKRHYVDETGFVYNSCTNVVGIINEKGLAEWREDIGEKGANIISGRAKSIGSKLHKNIEDLLNNKEPIFENLVAKAHYYNLMPFLNSINYIRGTEIRLCSKPLALAGTTDCIADYDGELSIIDFKTSSKEKSEEYLLSYFLQLTAYSLMWEELTGQNINQIVVLISAEDMSTQQFIKNPKDYKVKLLEVIKEFRYGPIGDN